MAPFGSDVVVIVSGTAATAMLSDFVAVLLLASVTFAVNVDVPDAAGVPEIVPVEAFRVNPAGSEPLLTDHEYGVVPPLACSVAE